jgi:hypothetical protein
LIVIVVVVLAVPASRPKLTDVAPAAIGYVLFTGKMVGLLEVKLITAPPAGAGALRVIYRYAVPPLPIVAGLMVKLLIVI